MELQDKTMKCKDCGEDFIFSVREQEFYAEKGFQNEPQRCKACRDKKKLERGSRDGNSFGGNRSGAGNGNGFNRPKFGNSGFGSGSTGGFGNRNSGNRNSGNRNSGNRNGNSGSNRRAG